MYVITNRKIVEGATGLDAFGDVPNSAGPKELRLAEATRSAGSWKLQVLPDQVTVKMKREVALADQDIVWASEYAARKTLKRVQKDKRNILFFVHGFNNNLEAVLNRAEKLSEKYNLEVIAFSWPANGGGLSGVASYKSDKTDAIASAGALDRTFGKMKGYLDLFNENRIQAARAEALKSFPHDPERRDQELSKAMQDGCPFSINMLLHSMGNYLLKNVLRSSAYSGCDFLFDNVVMCAADTNNAGHADWVDKLACRRNLYITINADDSALLASRVKGGEDQKARLGHWQRRLNSDQALYVDFTDVSYVGRSHAYFEGTPLRHKPTQKFFDQALNGKRAEQALRYQVERNVYEP